jgi:hypothetical protein
MLLAIPYLIAFALAALLIGGSIKALTWGLIRNSAGKLQSARLLGGALIATLLLVPIGYPFVRDSYRNILCERDGGATFFVSAAEWRAQHEAELISIQTVAPEKAYSAVGQHQSATRLNSRFTEEVRFIEAGIGVTVHDYRLVDATTGAVLAKWVRYYTGGWGREVISIGIPMSKSCFVGGREFLELRSQLAELRGKQ